MVTKGKALSQKKTKNTPIATKQQTPWFLLLENVSFPHLKSTRYTAIILYIKLFGEIG